MDPDRHTDASPAALSFARLDATIRGRVQGVGFRYFVLRRAMDLELVGWVANTADGSVRCVVEGPRPALEALLETLEIGPAGALVERVLSTWSAPTGGFVSFEIRSGGHRGD
ncbi:MAG: acylphosphatase [Candidatus Limnocylindrales bacterium]